MFLSRAAGSIEPMESRIESARARANRVNNVMLGAAAALFVAAMVAARIAHPARASQPASGSTASTAASSGTQQTYEGSSGYFGSGSVGSAQSVPQLSTGGS
jgi:hypothetical protein